MTQIEKRPYELSLWEDVVSVDDGVITTSEKRLATIGSHTSTSPIAAFDILLNRKINGEKTLTFSISASYYDQEEQTWRPNPHLARLTNERKVKLKWKDKWYDFIIKNVSEDSKKKVYTYTAKDQHIQELSRGGYNIQFDKELENNTKTPEEFVAEILKGTDWAPGNFSEFFEYTTEAVYEYKVPEGLALSSLFGGQSITLKGGETVFIPYSIIQNQSSRCQVLYGGDAITSTPARDDEGVLIDEIFKNYYFDTTYNKDGQPVGLILVKLRNDCRGKHYVRLAKTKYDANIDKYVKVYKNTKDNKEYYGYTETEYLDTEIAQNIITNSEDFVSTAGWKPAKIQEKDGQGKEISGNYGSAALETNPPFKDGFSEDYVNTEFLLSVPKQIFNTGFFDNKVGLGKLVEGQQYILDIEYSSKAGETGRVTNITVCDYEIRDASYAKKTNGTVYISNDIAATRTELTWKKTLSQEEIKDSKIGIFLTTNGNAKIKKIALYRKILDSNGELVLPNQIVFENKDIVSQKYCYYDPSQENYGTDSLKLAYEDLDPSADYELQYEDTYQKRRSLTASKSNRFNLLQKVCETFEGWLDIQVEHEPDGRIVPTIRNENGEIQSTGKKIGLKDFVGKENFAGFKYGTNLDSIKRTLDSNQITTKMIVESNANEFAKNGFCTITRSSLNPSGTNVVYNFDYYIKQGLLTQEATQEALNLYNKALKEVSEKITEKQNEKINKENLLMQAEAEATFEREHVEAAQKGLLEAEEDLLEVSKHDYQWFVNSSKADKESEEYKDFSNFLENSQCLGYLQEIIRYNQVIKQYPTENASASQVIVEGIKVAIEQLDIEIKQLIEQQKKIEIDFHNKFARFIQEGNWISEEYTDDDLYYIDALSTLYTSSRPKVTYTINVFDLSGIEGYENYQFEIGDKTFVQDPEFFGWTENEGVRTPYKEEIVISESTIGIDNLTKDAIKVQNYKTQFEDLFQRIAAATETLQYNTGRYEKFSSVVETDGSISHQALQEAVNKNGLAIIGAGHQTVSCDERGIIAVDDTNPSNQVRIIGGGVFLTEDGGASWTTGITGEGVNADTITSGIVNTGKVNIVSGGAKTHAWDDKGITSYKTIYNDEGVVTGVDPTTFVRQDEFGIYGIKNNAGFNARVMDAVGDDSPKVGVEKIERDASYALTWDGFMLKSSDNGGRVEIDSEDDFAVYDVNGDERIKIGRLGKGAYGTRIGTSQDGNEVILGNTGSGNETHGYEVIKAGPPNENGVLRAFTVYEDGHVYIPSAQIGGYPPASDLQGLEIVALTGNIMVQGGSLKFKVQSKVKDDLTEIKWTIEREDKGSYSVSNQVELTISEEGLRNNGLITDEDDIEDSIVFIDITVEARIQDFDSNKLQSTSASFERKFVTGGDGNGVTEIVNWYQLSKKEKEKPIKPENETDAIEKGWTKEVQTASIELPYLWGCEEIKYSKLQADFTEPRIISTYGNGVKSIYQYYQLTEEPSAPDYNKNSNNQSDKWELSPLVPTRELIYLWNLEVTEYIDGTFSTILPRLVGSRGEPGASGGGIPGTKGEPVRVYYRTNSTENIPIPQGTPNLTGKTDSGEDRLVDTWTIIELNGIEWEEGQGENKVTHKYHYVFSCTGVKTTEYDADGTEKSPVYGSWTSPELYKAYHENINQFNYAQFLKLTDFGKTDGLTYGTYKTKVPKVDANGEQEKDENGEPVLEEVDKEGLFVNASFINTGTLVVQAKPPEGTIPEDWEPETVLSIDADKGALMATNLTINASGLNLADNIFNFNVEKNGNPVTCLSFGLNGTEETSYIQALNRGATAEASQESIVVYCPGATQKSGTIRVNGGGSTKIASYSNGDSNIYLCLQKATKGTANEYTYISKESWGHNEVDKNEILYGRWLKCIVATGTDDEGKITSWLNGFVYVGGSDTGKATFGAVLPGTSYNNANNAAKANAKLTNYLKEETVTTVTLVKPATGGKGSKFDLYNDTIYLGPDIKLYAHKYTNPNTGLVTPQLKISIYDPRDQKDKIWFFGVTSSGAEDPNDFG